jgi:hypothetical protein
MSGGESLIDGGEGLERAYGRLLRWYPAGHQARHADEMLGVLMAGAGSRQRRPGLADSANLIGGALRIRIRAATTGSAGLWRDALARAGIVLPLAWVLLTLTLVVPGIALNMSQAGVQGILSPSVLAVYGQEYLPPLVVLIAVLLGWRRVALAAIAATVILDTGNLGLRYLPAFQPYDAAYLAVLSIAALALVATPGRARALLTWKHYLLTVAAAVAAGVAEHRLQFLLTSPPYSPRDPAPAGWPSAELAGLGVVAAITVILLVRSAASRRLLIVLAVPLYFYVAVILTPVHRLPNPLIYLPLAALAGAAVLLAVRWVRTHRRRPAAGGNA